MNFQIFISAIKYHVLFHVQKQIKLWPGTTQQISWCPRHPGAFRWISRLNLKIQLENMKFSLNRSLTTLSWASPLILLSYSSRFSIHFLLAHSLSPKIENFMIFFSSATSSLCLWSTQPFTSSFEYQHLSMISFTLIHGIGIFLLSLRFRITHDNNLQGDQLLTYSILFTVQILIFCDSKGYLRCSLFWTASYLILLW